MEIYQATQTDCEGVSYLFNLYREFYHQPSDFDGAMTFISERLEKRDSIIFVAVNHDRYVGFIQLYPSFSSIAMKRTWILNDLYVIQEARREGIGQSLMDAAINICIETGANSLSLQTAPDNEHARRLYKNNGFTLDNEYDSFIRYYR